MNSIFFHDRLFYYAYELQFLDASSFQVSVKHASGDVAVKPSHPWH